MGTRYPKLSYIHMHYTACIATHLGLMKLVLFASVVFGGCGVLFGVCPLFVRVA